MNKEKTPRAIKTETDLGQWTTYFYLDPKPDLTISAIRLSSKNGDYDRPEIQPAEQAFLATLFRQYPEKLQTWISSLKGLPRAHKEIIYKALWICNSEEGRKLLTSLPERSSSKAESEFLRRLTQKSPPDLLTMTITDPSHLDMLWAAFMASGDERYVKRIIRVLPWSEDERNRTKLMIGEMAAWSLASNVFQHEKVLEICQAEIQKSSPKVKRHLLRAIKTAEEKLKRQKAGKNSKK